MNDRHRSCSPVSKRKQEGKENDGEPSKQRPHWRSGFVYGDGIERHRMEARFQQWGKDRITTIVAGNWKALFEQISLPKGPVVIPRYDH